MTDNNNGNEYKLGHKPKTKVSMRYARLMPNYLIRAGDPRSTTFTFTPHNFMKIFEVVDWDT